MNSLRQWILGIVGAAIVSAFASSITPEGGVKKITVLACGMVTILALISPFSEFDYAEFSRSMSDIRLQSDGITDSAGETFNSLTRTIIEEECETYILDKGTQLGISTLSADVEVSWSEEGYWYPQSVELTSDADNEHRYDLAWYIESELGIPEDEQHWSVANEEE